MPTSNRPLVMILLAGVVLVGVVFAFRAYYMRPIDAYQNSAPPPGPNARPDPPNPDKVKKLPGAFKAGG